MALPSVLPLAGVPINRSLTKAWYVDSAPMPHESVSLTKESNTSTIYAPIPRCATARHPSALEDRHKDSSCLKPVPLIGRINV